jgi:CheY-like chemotaxis protein
MNKTPKILLVEDNDSDEVLALRALAHGKIADQTFVVRDGQAALDYIFCEGEFSNRPPCKPYLILLDLKLPKVDGLDVLKRLRAVDETKSIPVVILTSSNQEKDIAASISNGASRYMLKPVKLDELAEVLGQFLYSYSGMLKDLE